MNYKNVGRLVDLADGRIASPGQIVSLSKDQANDPHNKRLIEVGWLVEAAVSREAPSSTKTEGGDKK